MSKFRGLLIIAPAQFLLRRCRKTLLNFGFPRALIGRVSELVTDATREARLLLRRIVGRSSFRGCMTLFCVLFLVARVCRFLCAGLNGVTSLFAVPTKNSVD